MRAAAVLLIVVAACSAPRATAPDGGEPDAGTGGDAAVDADAGSPDAGTGPRLGTAEDAKAFVRDVVRAACLHFTKCYGGEQARSASLDPRLCAELNRGEEHRFLKYSGLILDGLLDGRRVLDLDKADRCREAMARLECPLDQLRPYPFAAACIDVAVAQVGEGGACSTRWDCVGHSQCALTSNEQCMATCQAVPASSCRNTLDCPAGETCDERDLDNLHCAAQAGAGEECAWVGCRAGLVCEHRTPNSGVCVPDPCADCGPDGRCDRSHRGRCVPGAPVGGSCETSRCVLGAFCNGEKRCEAAHAAGESCSAPLDCASGSCSANGCVDVPRCDPGSCAAAPDGLCHPLPAEGEPCLACSDGRACAPGLLCNPADGTCRADVPKLPACYAYPCPTGSECTIAPSGGLGTFQQICVPRVGRGERCRLTSGPGDQPSMPTECAFGLKCLPDAHGDLRCDEPPPDREWCGAGYCGAGERCEVEPDHCVPAAGFLPRAGEPCPVSLLATGLCADDTLVCAPTSESTGVCRVRRAPGEACTNLFDCGPIFAEYLCDVGGTNTCVRRPGPGEPCRMFGRTGLCDATRAWCDDAATPPTCRAFRQEGEPCTDRVECGELMGLASCGRDSDRAPRVCRATYVAECR